MLLDFVPTGARRVAIVGVAKNAGKTTVLNALLEEHAQADLVCGVLSVGVDGEAYDAISGARKPPVALRPGWLAATSDQMARKVPGLEVVSASSISTPLGELLVVRATRRCEVVLSGLRHRGDVNRFASELLVSGASRVIIDGAFDRIAAADPETADTVFVATGMVLADSVAATSEQTAALVRRLQTPTAEVVDQPPHDLRSTRCVRSGPVWSIAGADGGAADTIYVPGMVSDSVVEYASTALRPGGTLVARDPTRLLASDTSFRRFSRRNEVRVVRGLHIAAVTTNPVGRDGLAVDPVRLRESLQRLLPDLPVVDVCRSNGSGQGERLAEPPC